MWFFNQSLANIILGIVARVFMIMVLMPVHEAAHAFAAYKLGDDTARFRGRLTLNPLAHIDWLGAALILLFGFGWAEPVPVNPLNFRSGVSRKGGMAITAAAGPLSNLLMAFLFAALMKLVIVLPLSYQASYYLLYALQTIVVINLTLAVFNLLPVYPLDGSRLFAFFLPDKWVYWMEANSRTLSILLIVFVVSGAFSGIVNTVVNWLYSLIGLVFAF